MDPPEEDPILILIRENGLRPMVSDFILLAHSRNKLLVGEIIESFDEIPETPAEITADNLLRRALLYHKARRFNTNRRGGRTWVGRREGSRTWVGRRGGSRTWVGRRGGGRTWAGGVGGALIGLHPLCLSQRAFRSVESTFCGNCEVQRLGVREVQCFCTGNIPGMGRLSLEPLAPTAALGPTGRGTRPDSVRACSPLPGTARPQGPSVEICVLPANRAPLGDVVCRLHLLDFPRMGHTSKTLKTRPRANMLSDTLALRVL